MYLEEEPKTITAYISPGTPLMAFNWGMAALTNPEMKVNIISSSDPTKGVERIPLAHDLYFSREKRSKQGLDENLEFDVVFHLFGEQRIPSLLGVMQFESPHHVLFPQNFPSGTMAKFLKKGVFAMN